MISGGCLENDARERAREVMATGKPVLVTYDSTAPEDIIFGLGLGCNGVVKVMIEPLAPDDGAGFESFLSECLQRRLAGRIATVFEVDGKSAPIKAGSRLLRWPDGRVTASFQDRALMATLIHAMDASEGRRAATRRIRLGNGCDVGVLIETIAPPVPLIIFGGGEDAIPVANFAKLIGWDVTIIDARPAYALPERFPTADRVLCLRPESLLENPAVELSPQTVAMMMTHNFTHDKALLRRLLPTKLRYVGVLGPKSRTQKLLDELASEGITFSPECLSRLHGPAGLDIGAETPEEIAISIISEMRAVLADRNGGQLRDRIGSIHDGVDPVVAAA
jgi:xanthine/CO dehydrogenase XdhC/CoxF family maturation factor